VAYAIEIRHQGQVAVRGTLVAVLLDEIGGTPQPWPPEHRRLLETAGPQPPELLMQGEA
jgi:acyl-CoA thioesterase FadM